MIDVIDRLDGVRPHGPSHWVARCPAHADKSPSLSVTQTPDGLWLLHCFAGCEVAAIISALGLSFDDLFPDRVERDSFKRMRPRQILSASQRLALLNDESHLIMLAAYEMVRGVRPTSEDVRRLEKAIERIQQVIAYGA